MGRSVDDSPTHIHALLDGTQQALKRGCRRASEYTSEHVDLLDLLKRPEGKTLEFKRDLSSPDGVLRSLVAFANTSGGTVLIGVEDRTRHVRGVKEPLNLEERLRQMAGLALPARDVRVYLMQPAGGSSAP